MVARGRPKEIDIDAEQVLAGVIRWHAEAVASARQWLAECETNARLAPKNWHCRRDLAAAGHSVRVLSEQGVPVDAPAILGRPASKYERAVVHRLIRELIASGKLERTAGGVRPVQEVAHG